MNDTEAKNKAERALAVFAQALKEPQKRKAIADDPETAIAAELEREGSSIGDLPPKVLQFLTDLSHGELRLLSRMDATMREAGILDQVDTQFTLTKF